VQLSVFAERSSYMSYYDDIGDDNSVLDGDDNYSRYEPIFRVDRCAGSFSVQSYSMLNDATPCRSTVYVAYYLETTGWRCTKFCF